MKYRILRQNGQQIQEEPFYSAIVDAFTKDKTTVHFNWQDVSIEGANVVKGVTEILVRVG